MNYIVLWLLILTVSTGCYQSSQLVITGKVNGLDEDRQRHGLWVVPSDTANRIAFIHYSHGRKHGRYTSFYRNGNVQEIGRYRRDKLHGDWLWFDRFQNHWQTTTYRNDKVLRRVHYNARF
ncbi:MAG TPA: hypothetical protein VEY71_04195 [Chitinophagales bacterium]|nr:hypothetical protein [Chitinophagales bacterium]